MRKRNTHQARIEFDFRAVGDGRSAVARYANNSNYRNDSLIRKESMHSPDSPSPLSLCLCKKGSADGCVVCVSSLMIQEIKRIIKDSEILK